MLIYILATVTGLWKSLAGLVFIGCNTLIRLSLHFENIGVIYVFYGRIQLRFLFQMPPTVSCEVTECNSRVSNPMNHKLCATHCPCLTEHYVYDPSRCDHCKDFINNHFSNVSDPDIVAKGRKELNGHLKKLKRHVTKLGHSLAFHLYFSVFKKAIFPPVDFNYLKSFKLPVDFVPEALAEASSASSRLSSVSEASRASSSRATLANILAHLETMKKDHDEFKAEVRSRLQSTPSSPKVVIRRKKGGEGAVLEGFGSVSASPSPSVPSSMPPPASIPPASSAASPSPSSAALPPGTPLSSKLSVAPASSEAPRAGGKRAREEGGLA